MMIKIRIGKEKTHWLVIDNVKDIEYEYRDAKESYELYKINKQQQVPVRWIEHFSMKDLKGRKVAMVTVRYKDCPDEIIFTDDSIYILNDEGKTCDSVGVYN